MDYQEELAMACDYARESLPAEAYVAAMGLLYYGPSGSGAEMSWDEALAALRDWAGNIQDVVLTDYTYDDDGEGYEHEAGQIDASDIIRAVIGHDIASYL